MGWQWLECALADAGTPIKIIDPQLREERKDVGLYKWDDIVGDEMVASDKLFEVFVVVGLRSKQPATFFRFDAVEKPDKKTYSQLEPFCYPNVDVAPLRSMRPESFTFVLTNPMGGRRIGFCRRYLPAGYVL